MGYHIPSDSEWTTLTTFLGGEVVVGNKMKATTLWTPYSGIINTNSSSFTGLPGGIRFNYETFSNVGGYGYWWSSSELDIPTAWNRGLTYYGSFAGRSSYNKKGGFTVRCLRDS